MEQKKGKNRFLVASWCFFLFFRVSNSQTCWESGHSLISCINFSATVVGTSPSNHTSPYLQQPKYAKIVGSDPTSRNAIWHNAAPLLAMSSHLPMCQSSRDLDIWGHALEPKNHTTPFGSKVTHPMTWKTILTYGTKYAPVPNFLWPFEPQHPMSLYI